jgi:hypothetical protein
VIREEKHTLADVSLEDRSLIWALKSARLKTFMLVVGGREVLGVIVGSVALSRCPVEIELRLGYTVLEPLVSHVESLGSLHPNLGSKNIVGGGIVGFQWRAGWRLFVAHFFQGGEHWDGFLGVEEEATCLGFGCGGGDTFKCLAENVDCSVWFGGGLLVPVLLVRKKRPDARLRALGNTK